MVRPRIKICHLLLDPDESQDIPLSRWESTIQKQNASIKKFEQIAPDFSCYSKYFSVVNRTELPTETCAEPGIINYSKELINTPPVLSYGHYGCYCAHRNAIEDFGNFDAILVVEGDAVYDVPASEMSRSIYEAYEFGMRESASLLTFGGVSYGLGSRASTEDTSIIMGNFRKVDHFLPAHCYMVFGSEKESIQHKLKTTGWHTFDVWLYWNYDRKSPIFATVKELSRQIEGFSAIDYEIKNQEKI